MKIIYTLMFFGVVILSSNAQETTVNDALRLAVDNITGTARYKSMSGAFGAVGGDLSAINQNPAGSIFFNNNLATASVSYFGVRNKSAYFGTTTAKNDNGLDLNQAGVVFVFNDNSKSSGWNKINLAFNYENANNFNNTILSSGTNSTTSIGNYFLNFAQGIPLDYIKNYNFNQLSFNEQQAYLGFDTYIFEANDPSNLNNVDYYTNIPTGGNYYQENFVNSRGYNGKMTANFSTAYKNKLFLGANLNFNFVDIQKVFNIYESNNNPLYDQGSTITEILFRNELHTFGSGISFNFGAIYQPIDNFRLGVAYESPTWYRLTDQLTQGVVTTSINNQDNNTRPSSFNDTQEFLPYYVQTPSKWTGSLAYIFGKSGLLSADVSMKDYSTTRLKPKNDQPFASINSEMNSALDNAVEVRLGGEYKIKQFALRGGYRFEQSPYKVDQSLGDLTGYSGGVGYTFGVNRIDLAYAHEYRNMNQAFLSSGMTDMARINRKNNTVSLSYTINF
ncbi:OmpP1/FadL family transporter [Flavobacterium sp.]